MKAARPQFVPINGHSAPAVFSLKDHASDEGSLDLILSRVHRFLCDYVVFPTAEQPIIISLWIAHTWVVEAFEFTPYLSVQSPVKRCGKTTLLDCLKLLVNAPWSAVNPSPAVLYRKIQQDCPTLLLDEVDTIFSVAKGDTGKEDVRGVLNAGFQRSATIPRCVGPMHQLQEFSVFCPKALAGIGRLPDTVADRSIPIVLARKSKAAQVAKFRHRDVKDRALELNLELSSWALDEEIIAALEAARPELPSQLGDRAADICEPLLALADLAGGDWPHAARESAVQLCTGKDAEDENLPTLLLAAIREIFHQEEDDRLSSKDLLQKLVDREDGLPWAHWWEAELAKGNVKGPASRLANLLKPFGVGSHQIRFGTENVRGYKLDSFQDAFDAYLPSPSEL